MKNISSIQLVSLLIGVPILIIGTLTAEPLTFNIKPGSPNKVQFTSVAKMETIVGVTDQITGSITVDPDDLMAQIKAEFTVDMASLDTDNRLRNGHMRKNHLHTKKFPTSKFVMKSRGGEMPARLSGGNPVEFEISGDFTCHGITREEDALVTATWRPATRTIETVVRFDVVLSDYKIPRPRFLILKLDERQQVEVRFTAVIEK